MPQQAARSVVVEMLQVVVTEEVAHKVAVRLEHLYVSRARELHNIQQYFAPAPPRGVNAKQPRRGSPWRHTIPKTPLKRNIRLCGPSKLAQVSTAVQRSVDGAGRRVLGGAAMSVSRALPTKSVHVWGAVSTLVPLKTTPA